MGITSELVNYILSTKFEDIPAEAVSRTKDFILDEIGNALGGSVIKSGKIIINWGKLWGGAADATIFSDGIKVPVAIASGVNTQLCMGLELMETYRNRCHPGSGMVMTALAFGEKERLRGKDIIAAVCTAYDVTGRIIDATWPSREHLKDIWNQPWQGCGPLVVAIKLLGLTFEQGMHAFGMGLGNGPTANVHHIIYVPGSMSKIGNQFHNFVAINAAFLAKMGYTGYHEILDEPFPFWRIISDTERKDIYDKDLGQDFFITTAMNFKPWPTCRWAQPGIQSLLEIMDSENLDINHIREIVYHSHEKVTGYPYDNINPSNPEDAYWSVPWAFAAAAKGYPVGPSWYMDSLFANDEFKDVMKKIKIKTWQESVEAFEKEPDKSLTLLEVKTDKGVIYERRTEYCKGDPQQPMSRDEILNKFLSQAESVISKEKANRIIEFVGSLENMKDISDISKLVY
ncbi:MAG: MmgE/PrpD family protein [Deltaproteobacteria bacterium]|nr:MmgE/PrpD family protein [Deltaproteobacteria bacterium]